MNKLKLQKSNQVFCSNLSNLPYVLGHACAAGILIELQVNLLKPILVVGSGDKCIVCLAFCFAGCKG